MHKTTFHNKLSDYSVFSCAFILMHQVVSGQVIYTDVEPDLELNFDGDVQFLDIDNNGSIDFGFLKTSFSYSYFSTFSAEYRLNSRRAIWAGAYFSDRSLAGGYYTDGYGTINLYSPYKLNSDSVISSELSFQSAPFQLMALVTKRLDIPDDWAFDNGKWHGITVNKYLGIRFDNGDGCKHYGWVRCTIEEDLSKLIIHDYAYESNCDVPIAAGDTISYVDIHTLPNTKSISIYSFENQIHIQLMSSQYATVNIYDITGNKILFKTLAGNSETINMKYFAAGIYVVSVKQGENVVTKKVSL